ncbi:hypothetical protein M3Y98_00074200 [Aphelenchoides besseyi]|nr:hypothetical protein M3Y98_00074200 [Aphelenchoides besseyi]
MNSLILLSLVCVVDLAVAQYKAPLYMGFLMPKKYVRNLTNNQSKVRPANCGAVCPNRLFAGAYNPEYNQDYERPQQPTLQFSSYNTNPPLQQQNFKPTEQNQWENQESAALNTFKFTIPIPSNGKSDFQPKRTFFPVGEQKNCCANQLSVFAPTTTPTPSMANVLMNVMNQQRKNSWDAPQVPYEQWIRQQPQSGGPFVLYPGPENGNQNANQLGQQNYFGNRFINQF